MPKAGDVARAKDVGLGSGYHKCVWHACEVCKAERWVLLRRGTPQSKLCYPCGRVRSGQMRKENPLRGKDHPRWKGGRHVHGFGYIQIWIPADDPLRVMADDRGRVFEHRLVVARHLGRPLASSEEVHHVNHNKADNRLENLEVRSKAEHAFGHSQCRDLLARIAQLESQLSEPKGG
jgi:hypothetical protein